MKQDLKQYVRDSVQQGKAIVPLPLSLTSPTANPVLAIGTVPASYPAAPADELVIEITGNAGMASVTLRPFEVSRLRGRFGRGPGFEQWVAARMRDAMISFGGG